MKKKAVGNQERVLKTTGCVLNQGAQARGKTGRIERKRGEL